MKKTVLIFLSLIFLEGFPQSKNFLKENYSLSPKTEVTTFTFPSFLKKSKRFITNKEHGPISVYFELGQHVITNEQTNNLVEIILNISSWKFDDIELKEKLNAVVAGRSIVLPLKKKIFHNGTFYRAVKIKGVTDNGTPPKMIRYDSISRKEKIKQPSKNLIIRSGKVTIVKSQNKPTGTCLFDRVIEEYHSMLLANLEKVPTGLPLGIGLYPEWRFEGKQVGFVVIALEDFPDLRLGDHFTTLEEQALEKDFFDLIENYQQMNTQNQRALNSAAIALRKLHKAGIVMKNPHLYNFSAPNKTTDIKIYDLENALLTQEISEEEFIFWIYYDFRRFFLFVASRFQSQALLDGITFNYLGITPNKNSKKFRQMQEALHDLDRFFLLSSMQFITGEQLTTLFKKWEKNIIFREIQKLAKRIYKNRTHSTKKRALSLKIASSL